jgi:hypothetical protein
MRKQERKLVADRDAKGQKFRDQENHDPLLVPRAAHPELRYSRDCQQKNGEVAVVADFVA